MFLRAFWPNLASGNRETPYSDVDTAPRGPEVPRFTVPFPARFSATPQIPGDPMRGFRGTPVFTMFSTPRFGLRWSVALVASLGSFGYPRGLLPRRCSIRAVKPGVSEAEEPRSAWKMHTNSAPPMGPSGERFCPRSHGRSWRGPGTPFLGIWSDSEGTRLDLRWGPPLGPSGENSARAAYEGGISRMSAFGGRNGRFSSCFPVELGRPSGPQGGVFGVGEGRGGGGKRVVVDMIGKWDPIGGCGIE